MAKYSELILNGHGGWNLKEAPAWAQVPRNTTIKFFTENMRLMLLEDIDDEDTALRILQQFRDATPNQEGGPYSYVPNYTLSDDGVSGAPEWVIQVNGDIPLCTNDGSDPDVVCDSGIHRCQGLFALDEVVGATLYWAACRYVTLAEAGDLAYSATTGVNQQQPEFGEEGLGIGLGYELEDDTIDRFLQSLMSMTSEQEMEAAALQIRGRLTEEQADMVERRIKERAQELAAEHESDEDESEDQS